MLLSIGVRRNRSRCFVAPVAPATLAELSSVDAVESRSALEQVQTFLIIERAFRRVGLEPTSLKL